MSSEQTSTYFKRLASFGSLPKSGLEVFRTNLAQQGFYYTGRGLDIECEGCKVKVQIVNDLSLMVHKTGCFFDGLLKGLVNENVTHSLGGKYGANNLTIDGLDVKPDDFPQLRHANSTSPVSSALGSMSEAPISHLTDFEGRISCLQYREERKLSSSSFATPSSYYSHISSELIDLSAYFKPEFLIERSTKVLVNLNFSERDCKKNPGHFGHFNLNSLVLDRIPSVIRCSEMLPFLKLMGDLTVRVIVSHNGSQNAANQQKVIAGTGFVMDLACEGLGRKRTKIFIQTSRHLVYNNKEAHHASVEFFYDDKERKNVVTLAGKDLMISDTPGDSQCVLVCESSDVGFIQKLNQTQTDFRRAADQLPVKTKKGLCKKVFIIHHPHGCHKVLSYGDYVTVNYKLNNFKDEQGQATLTRMTPKEKGFSDTSHYRKALLYTADTCPGSCGAPVLTYIDRSPSSFSLDIWMHNGLETEHKLGVSSLKVSAKEDLLQPRENEESNDEEAADSRSQLSAENIPLKLVEAENKTLKNQLICKLCRKSDVRDMFLPCGELFACSDCSKSLTICPSCQKPILATVTVYLT